MILAVLVSSCCAGLASLLLSLGLARPQDYFDGFCSSVKRLNTFEDIKKKSPSMISFQDPSVNQFLIYLVCASVIQLNVFNQDVILYKVEEPAEI